jgi:hypothetical protein
VNPENSDTIILWNYGKNTERITQKPAKLMFNIWHTNDWAAEDKPRSTETPRDTFWAEFDWIKYENLGTFEEIGNPQNPTFLSDFTSKKPKTKNNTVKSIQRYSDKTVLILNEKNVEVSVFSVSGRKLYESKITKNECVIPNFQQKIVALVRKNGKIICQLSL